MEMHFKAFIIHIRAPWTVDLFLLNPHPYLIHWPTKNIVLGTVKFTVWARRSYNELKGYLDHYLGLLTGSYGKVNENQIDKVSLLNDFLQVYNVRYYTKVQQ